MWHNYSNDYLPNRTCFRIFLLVCVDRYVTLELGNAYYMDLCDPCPSYDVLANVGFDRALFDTV